MAKYDRVVLDEVLNGSFPDVSLLPNVPRSPCLAQVLLMRPSPPRYLMVALHGLVRRLGPFRRSRQRDLTTPSAFLE